MKIEEYADFQVINTAFPHLGKKIRLFWGNPEFVTLMLSLQQDTRGGKRAGFPGPVLLALMSLEEAHDVEFPKLKRKVLSGWQLL